MKYLLQRNYYTDNVYRGYFPRHACLILEGEGRRKEGDRYKFVERFADFLREFSLPIFSRGIRTRIKFINRYFSETETQLSLLLTISIPVRKTCATSSPRRIFLEECG